MSLINQARKDFQRISTSLNEFSQTATMFDIAGNSAQVKCLYTLHHTGFDPEGFRVNTKTASIAVSQLELDALYYDYSDPSDNTEISFKNHRVTAPDGVKYKVREWYPDNTLGCFILILQKYA